MKIQVTDKSEPLVAVWYLDKVFKRISIWEWVTQARAMEIWHNEQMVLRYGRKWREVQEAEND